MGALVMGLILLVLLVSFVAFYRYSRSEAWWESQTRKALLNGMIALAPFLGMRYHKPHPEPPTISTPVQPEPRDDHSPSDE